MVVRITALGEDGGTPESLDPVGSAFERYDLLGYDVADYDLLGGLTNCGYTPQEAASLAPVWAPLLNEWHLFDKPEDATMAHWHGSGAGNTLIGAMRGDSRESTMTIKGPETAAHGRS